MKEFDGEDYELIKAYDETIDGGIAHVTIVKEISTGKYWKLTELASGKSWTEEVEWN